MENTDYVRFPKYVKITASVSSILFLNALWIQLSGRHFDIT